MCHQKDRRLLRRFQRPARGTGARADKTNDTVTLLGAADWNTIRWKLEARQPSQSSEGSRRVVDRTELKRRSFTSGKPTTRNRNRPSPSGTSHRQSSKNMSEHAEMTPEARWRHLRDRGSRVLVDLSSNDLIGSKPAWLDEARFARAKAAIEQYYIG